MSFAVDRYGELIKRLANVKGGEALREIAPEILLALVLENDRPEHQVLGNTKFWSLEVVSAQVAGQFSSVLQGAPGPTSLTVIKGFIPTVACNYGLLQGATPAGFSPQAAAGGFRDNRSKGKPGTAQNVFVRQNAASIFAGGGILLQAGAGQVVTLDGFIHVISSHPGVENWLPYFEATVVNVALGLFWWGYERQVEQDENDSTVG